MIVENVSQKTKGIQMEGKWHTVVGPAERYVASVQKGDDIEVKLNEKEQIVFIRKAGMQPIDRPEMTEDMLFWELPMKPLGNLYAMSEEKLNAIIEQQSILALAIKNNTDLIMQLAKHLKLNLDEIKTANTL